MKTKWSRICLKNGIFKHLTDLENEFSQCFPEFSDEELDLVGNPFKLSFEKIPDDCQDKFLEVKTDVGATETFHEKLITEFWPLMCDSYSNATKIIPCIDSICVDIFLWVRIFNSIANENQERNRLWLKMSCVVNFQALLCVSKNWRRKNWHISQWL